MTSRKRLLDALGAMPKEALVRVAGIIWAALWPSADLSKESRMWIAETRKAARAYIIEESK